MLCVVGVTSAFRMRGSVLCVAGVMPVFRVGGSVLRVPGVMAVFLKIFIYHREDFS